MAFWVPLEGGVVWAACAPASVVEKRIRADIVKEASVARGMVAVFSPALLSRLVRMIESEVKKLYLRVFVVVDVAMGSLIIGNVIESHTGGLAAELVSNKGEASSIKCGPNFLDVRVIGKVGLTNGERIHGDCQDTLQGG